MPILIQDVVDRAAAALDSEDSQYFIFSRDYLPAILSAQDWITGVVNKALGQKKFSEEILQDLTLARVFQTSSYSRIQVQGLGHDVWTILGVSPLCDTVPAFSVTVPPNPQDSIYRNDLTYLRSDYSANRLNADEWDKNVKNPFFDGHDLEAGESISSFSFINYTDFTSTGYTLTAPAQELEVRPSIPNLPVMIRYVKVPTKPTLITGFVEYPMLVFDIFTDAVLYFMSRKIGDGTTIYQLATQDLMTLITG